MTTLLLIEDNHSLRKNIAELLSLEGYQVLTASDGADGLQQAREHKPDLVL